MNSGRRSAPPMLPSPQENRLMDKSLAAVGANLPPRNNAAGGTNAVQNAGGNARKPAANQGAGGGKMHYRREDELNDLMDIMEELLPIGKYEKERVAERYNMMHPTRPREYPNLMTQLVQQVFATKKPPTGDPECPPLVRRAKQIVNKIRSKAGIACFTEQDEDDVLEENARKKTTTSRAIATAADDGGSERKPAVIARSSTKKTRKEDTSKSLMEMFMASEMAACRREELMEKRRHNERQQLLSLGVSVLQSFTPAFTANPISVDQAFLGGSASAPCVTQGSTSDSEGDDSSLSSALSLVLFGKNGKKRPFNDRIEDWKMKYAARKQKKSNGSTNRKNKKTKRSATNYTVIMMLDSSDEKNNKDDDDKDMNDASDDGGADKVMKPETFEC
jgi:hypothetical protein